MTNTKSRSGRSVWGRAILMAQNGWRIGNVLTSRMVHRPPRYLPIVLMFITDRCNLRCKMCGVCEHDTRTARDSELSTDQWKAVIRSARKMRTTILSISGGEPLLRPDVFELIRYARDCGLAVHMCTNGVLMNEEAAARLGESGVNTVSVSIESPHREIHEMLRGAGSFEPAVQSIRLLREHAPKVHVGINYLITTANFRGMSEMIGFSESLDVDQVKFAPIHTNLLHRKKRIEQYAELLFRKEDIEELDKEIARLVETAEKSPLITTSPMFFSGISALYAEPHSFRCYAGYAACAITPTGLVSPCCDMDGVLSVRDMPLEKIWRSPEFQRLRDEVHRCKSSCWDTTNTELSLRLRPSSLIGEVATTWKDIGFYFGREK